MRTSVILSLASLLVFAVIVYEGYRYYENTALERACSDTERALENTSRSFLLGRVNELSSAFRMQALGSPSKKGIDTRLSAVRQKVNGLKSMELSTKLSEAEVLSDVLGDYLEPGAGCSLFGNMVRMGQANVISIYTVDYRRSAANVSFERISELGSREYGSISDGSEETSGSCGRRALSTDREEEYCQALKSLNAELGKNIERSLKGTKDAHSLLYKSMLANCVSGCRGSEPSCIANCWLAKKAVFE